VVEITLATESGETEGFSWVMQVADLSTAAAMQLQLKTLGISVQLPPVPPPDESGPPLLGK
jgi:hypothetical protein